jgi:LmbE family N-acetylglucosaminyl deacetylase
MKLCTFFFLLASLSCTSLAQTTAPVKFTDPANLRGERVKPIDGHELPIDQGALGVEQMLRKLGTRASLMNIVAHPDDEDGGMLTLYSRGMGARVADLSLNRGEGGQNAMTADFEDALGLIRTQEILACDRYSDVDQFFGTQVDFGFSKTKEEAFAKWDHDRVLYDVVRAIRLYHPLVLVSTWIGGVTDGHGQHQVSGQIAQEAFKAAGDPAMFPEMIAEGILPWQPVKIYARVPGQSISDKGLFDYATGQYTPAKFTNYVTGEVTTTAPSTDVVVHEGTPDKLLAAKDGQELSYAQFSRIGLGMQKSQIGGNMRTPGPGKVDVNYHRFGSSLPAEKQKQEEDGFFDGIDTSIESIAELAPGAFPNGGLAAVQHEIAEAQKKFKPSHPDDVAPELASAIEHVDKLIKVVSTWDGDAVQKENALHELKVKRVQLNEAMVLALGVQLRANLAKDRADGTVEKPTTLSDSVNPKQEVYVRLKFDATSYKVVHVLSYDVSTTFKTMVHASIFSPGAEPDAGLTLPSEGYIHPAKIMIPATAKSTMPYFFRKDIEQPIYELSDEALRNAPATPEPIVATFHLKYRDATFDVVSPVMGLHTYSDGATNVEPVMITAPVSIASALPATVFPVGLSTLNLSATLRTSDSVTATINMETPVNWTIDEPQTPSPVVGYSSTVDFSVHPPTKFSAASGAQIFQISATTPDQQKYTESFRAVGYPGLLTTNLYTPATSLIVPVNLKLPAKRRIGYVAGTGDSVPEALASINLRPTMLTVADLTAEKLATFDTVILGVRTYAAHADLHGAPTQALLDYAKNGGNVIVQYQSAEFTADDAPYPLTLGHDAERVVDETDAVQLLKPTYSMLAGPNKITPSDFNGWNAERGHGFLQTWDSHYVALTETHDPGEAPQRGGLITTPLGKGRWTYVAFALYRQLPEAVPGAYRLFANLLSADAGAATPGRSSRAHKR